MSVRLINVYQKIEGGEHVSETTIAVLYNLLQVRPSIANISHREMPSDEAHRQFIANKPYFVWYLVEVDSPLPGNASSPVGAVYLSKDDEIGVAILPEYWDLGYGSAAVLELTRLHPRKRYFANVAPLNQASHRFFQALQFKPIQMTYELRNP